MSKHLLESATLFRLRIGGWSAKTTDAGVAREVEESKHANGRVVHVVKHLMRSDNLDIYRNLEREARAYLRSRTLPWMDGNLRIGKAENALDILANLKEFRVASEEVVQDIVKDWDEAVQREQERQGELFNPADYPNAREVERKFHFDVDVFPVPDMGDWRVKAMEQHGEEVVTAMQASLDESYNRMARDAFLRLSTAIEKVAEPLRKPGARLYESVFDGLGEIVALMPDLNVMDDPELTKLAEEARLRLCCTNVEVIRGDDTVRSKLADDAAAILKKMEHFVA